MFSQNFISSLSESHRLSLCLALDALELDELAGALAVAARGTHDEGSRGDRLHSRSVAVLTPTRFRSRFASTALALGTRVHDVHVDVLVDTARRLREGQRHLDLLGTAKAEGGLGKVVELAAESLVAEDLAEQLLRIDRRLVLPGLREALGTGPGTTASSTTHLLGSLSVHVVLASLRLIAEHFVGLGDLLELFAGIRVVLVRVRMVFLGQLVVRLLDVLRIALAVHAQDLVVVAVVQSTGAVEAATALMLSET